MPKKRIYIWITGISLLLILLTGIQIAWLRDAADMQQRETKLRVIKALEKTEEELKNTNYCMITYSKAFFNPNEGFYMLHQHTDSAGKKGRTDTVHMYTNDETFTHTDTVLYDLQALNSMKYPIIMDMQLRFKLVVDDTADYYKEKDAFYHRKHVRRVNDLLANNSSLDSMFDMNLADSLLKRNLQLEKVPAPYGFAFISKQTNKIVYARRITDSPALLRTPYAIDIFPDNKFLKPHRLAFAFTAGQASFKANYWLVCSILIISVLAVSFFAFVRLYIGQVKLTRMRSDFINNLTHEFNTPIANIALAIETLEEDHAAREGKTGKIFNIISTESARLRDNIDRALQVTALDRGEITLHKETTDLVALIKTILSSYQLQCEQLGGRIEFIHPPQLLLLTDETHLLNCVCNLLENAIKYRKTEPIITITLQDEGIKVSLAIADNGIGMSQETQKHIFEKFYRAPEGDIHNCKGFGLGLCYVKGIVDAHRGTIVVKSALGAGSVFIIHLPMER